MVAVGTHTAEVFIVSPSTLIVNAQLQLIIEQKWYNITVSWYKWWNKPFFTQEALSFELGYICIQESDTDK